MSSSCVQQAYQDPLSHDGQNIRYVNPSSITQPQQQQNPYDYYTKRQQPHQRRFSYTSMLSDPEQCYLPTISNSSPSNDSEDYSSAQQEPPTTVVSPASVASFIDPIFVDLQTKHHQAGLYHHHQQHSILMDHRSPLHHHQSIQYYDPHQKSFNQHNGNMFNHHHHRNSSPMIHQQSQAGYPISSLCSTPTPTSATIMPHHNHEKYSSRPMTPVSPPLIVKDNHFIAPEDQNASAEANAAGAASKIKKTPRSRGRRVSNIPGCGARMFTCKMDNCGKVFKRSEHLKRHVRSIHTLEKPFECPYQSCNKRFSRSDNLNQHIRIHRHTNTGNKAGSTSKTSSSKHHKQLNTADIHHNLHYNTNASANGSTNSNSSTFSNFI